MENVQIYNAPSSELVIVPVCANTFYTTKPIIGDHQLHFGGFLDSIRPTEAVLFQNEIMPYVVDFLVIIKKVVTHK